MNEFKIFTGNFANLKKYEKANLYPISIALSARYFKGKHLPELCPKWDWMREPEISYTSKYNSQILKRLDIGILINKIKTISKGCSVVLLCHEKYGDFCHRQLVAKWINENSDMKVTEFGKSQMEQKTLF